jgi:hypothetical protein
MATVGSRVTIQMVASLDSFVARDVPLHLMELRAYESGHDRDAPRSSATVKSEVSFC